MLAKPQLRSQDIKTQTCIPDLAITSPRRRTSKFSQHVPEIASKQTNLQVLMYPEAQNAQILTTRTGYRKHTNEFTNTYIP